MDSSTPKRWFYANWIKSYSILEKKSTSAQYVTKICSISYTLTQGEGNRHALTRGKIFVSRNAKWCLILYFWSELTLFWLNLTIKRLLVVLLRTWVTQVQKIANFWENFKSSRNTWFCVEWTPPLLRDDLMPIGLNYIQFWRKNRPRPNT